MSPPVDLIDRFLSWANSAPDHAAVVEDDRTVNYGAMAILVRRLAAAMVARGAQPRVLIHLPQCAEAYAAMFASLLAGGTYAPTNVSAPAERQQGVYSQFAPDVVISTSAMVEDLGLLADDPKFIDISGIPEVELQALVATDKPAYVMFTSGSTGAPKGVVISRPALAHYVDWAMAAMAVTSQDRWSQHPNIGFDLSVLDIYGALCAGATLFPLTSDRDRLFPAEAIRRHRLTIWNSVPSVMDLMKRARHATAERLASVRLFTYCGEPLLKEHLETIFSARPDALVHNTYGPTEATVSFTLIRVTKDDYQAACHNSVALGDAIPGMTLFLRGGETEDEGEIVIAGPQVGDGYWRDTEQTDAAFGKVSVNGVEQPSYNTGDWAARLDGQLYFRSRIDRQIKIQGNRLELGDVDAALRAGGADAACTIMDDGRLHAFVEYKDGLDASDLRNAVGQRLPRYGVPSAIVFIAALPRSANDKIDAGRLLEMHRSGEIQIISNPTAATN